MRDNTVEQKTLQREIYNATHDRLTQVYNRAGYDLLLSRTDLKTTLLLLADGDHFKSVNDRYGHETGDRVLQKIACAASAANGAELFGRADRALYETKRSGRGGITFFDHA